MELITKYVFFLKYLLTKNNFHFPIMMIKVLNLVPPLLDRQRSYIFNWPSVAWDVIQLDGVGPVDNRPSTDKLHQFF